MGGAAGQRFVRKRVSALEAQPMTPEKMTFEQLCEQFNYTPTGRPQSRKKAADFLGLSVDTLEGYGSRGVGPKSYKPPGTRRVWYSERDLLAWLASGSRRSLSEQSAAK
jgi:hypothetical protein